MRGCHVGSETSALLWTDAAELYVGLDSAIRLIPNSSSHLHRLPRVDQPSHERHSHGTTDDGCVPYSFCSVFCTLTFRFSTASLPWLDAVCVNSDPKVTPASTCKSQIACQALNVVCCAGSDVLKNDRAMTWKGRQLRAEPKVTSQILRSDSRTPQQNQSLAPYRFSQVTTEKVASRRLKRFLERGHHENTAAASREHSPRHVRYNALVSK